jgi:hypothetical protein
MKRQQQNRNWRRAHIQGAHNMVLKGEKKPSNFRGRLRAMLLKVFRDE